MTIQGPIRRGMDQEEDQVSSQEKGNNRLVDILQNPKNHWRKSLKMAIEMATRLRRASESVTLRRWSSTLYYVDIFCTQSTSLSAKGKRSFGRSVATRSSLILWLRVRCCLKPVVSYWQGRNLKGSTLPERNRHSPDRKSVCDPVWWIRGYLHIKTTFYTEKCGCGWYSQLWSSLGLGK